MGDDNLTFQVCTDDEHPEVYLEMWMDCSNHFDVWDTPVWSRPFRRLGRRISGAFDVLFKGSVKANGAFLFRGEEHIDSLCEVLQREKSRMVSLKKHRYPEKENKEINDEQ